MNQELRVNCNECGAFTEYTRNNDDPKSVVRCGDCGKRHSTDSVWMVDPTRNYERDERGSLLEKPF